MNKDKVSGTAANEHSGLIRGENHTFSKGPRIDKTEGPKIDPRVETSLKSMNKWSEMEPKPHQIESG